MNELISCPECGTNFVVNPNKHKNRDYRISPCCHVKVEQPSFFNKDWSPSKEWIEKRIEERRLALERSKVRMLMNLGLLPQGSS